MPTLKDYYKVLGVSESASDDEIKKAYRILARQYHPDRNQGDAASEEQFKEVQEAYDTLSENAARRKYDRARKHPFGSAFGDAYSTGAGGRYYQAPDGTFVRMDRGARGARPGGRPGPGFGPGGGVDDENPLGGIGDLFGRFFGGDGEMRTREEPDVEVAVAFGQALKGGKSDVRLPDGRTVRIPYPKGVADGYRVRLRNREGGAHFVRFRVKPSKTFRRDGDDLLTTVTVNIFEAVLGASRSITTPYGKKLKLTVPKGAQPGEQLRLRNQGVKTDSVEGDLIVEIVVEVPTKLTRFEEEEIRKAAEKIGLL